MDPSGTYTIKLFNNDDYTTLLYSSHEPSLIKQPDLSLATQKDHLSKINSVAGDQYGEYLAVAFENGKVIIGNIEWGDFLYGGLIIDDLYKAETVNITRDFFFSYDNQYLVWLTEDRISVWHINVNKARLILNETVTNGNVAAVDRSGKWLALGTDESLIFYNLEDLYGKYMEAGKLQTALPDRVIEINTSVQSIFFSWDNTMLFWGDNEGRVHIWGEEW